MNKDEYVIAKLQIELEVDVGEYSKGFIKGFIHGFRKGSQVDKHKDTELCFVTKIILQGKTIDEFEFAEVIKTDKNKKD